MSVIENKRLAGYGPAPSEDWYRHNYFNNDIDMSGRGVVENTFKEVRTLTNFSLDKLDEYKIKGGETIASRALRERPATSFGTGTAKQVMTSSGANEALQLIALSLFEPGDEIITQRSCYPCHDKIAEAFGCRLKRWALKLHDDASFHFHIADLKALLNTVTKALILNFQNNPSGKSIRQAELDEIIELAVHYDCYLIWGAFFQDQAYDSAALVGPVHHYKKAISVGTFSKFIGATGLHFSWIIEPNEAIAGSVRQKDYGNHALYQYQPLRIEELRTNGETSIQRLCTGQFPILLLVG